MKIKGGGGEGEGHPPLYHVGGLSFWMFQKFHGKEIWGKYSSLDDPSGGYDM